MADFLFPAQVRFITDVPEDMRDLYRYQPSSKKHVLRPDFEAEIGPLRLELERMTSMCASLKSKYETEMAAMRTATVADSVRAALTAAGVKNGLVAGAAAIMRDVYPLTVLESGSERHVVAKTEYGTFGLDQLVPQFLASDEGKVFAPAKSKQPGHFASQLNG